MVIECVPISAVRQWWDRKNVTEKLLVSPEGCMSDFDELPPSSRQITIDQFIFELNQSPRL